MKKFLILFVVLLLTLGAFSLTACSLSDNGGETASVSTVDPIRSLYPAYVKSGGTLSYEEWVDSIKGEKGDTGAAGVGIASIAKTGTEGLVDTYTITLTNGSTTTFTVTNSKDGSSGSTSTNPNAPTPDEYFRFTLLEDGTYEISARYNDMPARVVIPSVYNGKPVTSIAEEAFLAPEHLKSSIDEIIVPDTVKSIGRNAFYACDYLRYNEIGNGLYLGNDKTQCVVLIETKNKEITQIAIPEGVKYIYDDAFRYCLELRSISIPASVKGIGSGVFYGVPATEINYQGTKAQWAMIELVRGWTTESSISIIHCTDGDIEVERFR